MEWVEKVFDLESVKLIIVGLIIFLLSALLSFLYRRPLTEFSRKITSAARCLWLPGTWSEFHRQISRLEGQVHALEQGAVDLQHRLDTQQVELALVESYEPVPKIV